MSTHDAGKALRLETPEPESRRAAAPAAPVQTAAPADGLVGLGAKAAPAPSAPAGGGLVGLGAKPAPAASAPAGGGLVGLGATPAPAASAPAGGLVGLGAKPAPASSAPAGGGLVGLGAKPAPAASASSNGIVGLGAKPAAAAGLTGLGASAPAAAKPAATAPAPAARKSGIAIDITAAERIQKLLSGRGTPEAGLRIRVRGGGCTGLTYDMEFADEARDKDRVFEDHQVKIFVDPKSYIFLIGTTLTYSAGLMESGFKLENPNAKKACGCGDSFSV